MSGEKFQFRQKELAEKWMNGSISSEEEKEFADWYNAGQNTPVEIPSSVAESEEEHARKIFAVISGNQIKQASVKRLWLIRAAAVAAGFMLIASLFFYLNNKKSQPGKETITNNSPAIKDVLPGSTRATLTLDDGTQIILDTARNGLLAQQGNSSVLNKNGELVYNNSGESGKVYYNTLTTKKGEQYPLTLSDGTKIIVDAFTSIRFPSAFPGKERIIEINGRAWFEVAKNKDKPFYVVKGDKKIKVLGTHFDVNAFDNEPDLKVTLVEGSVEVSNAGSVNKLKPGQQAILSGKIAEIKIVENADVEEATAWRKGIMSFHGADIHTILNELERWYNVDVEIRGSLTKRSFYFDVSRNVSLSEIIKVLKINKINVTMDPDKRKLVVFP